MLVVDTSGLLAALFPDQGRHAECPRILTGMEGPFILSPFVLAELDYLVAKLANVETELRLLHEVASGAYALAPAARSRCRHRFGRPEVTARRPTAREPRCGPAAPWASTVG